MKSNKVIFAIALMVLMVGSCKQEVIILNDPDGPLPPPPASKGNGDFTKFIAIGDSYTAGMQGGALFDDGQANSMAMIMATQFAVSGVDGGAFNQPDINSVNGFNASASNPGGGIIRGRYVLFDPDGPEDPDGDGCQVSRSPTPKAAGSLETTVTCPSTEVTPALPAPYNTAQSPLDPGFVFAGDKATLNNYGVPGARIFHAGVNGYGLGNPYFGRFATDPNTNSMMSEALSKGGTFYMLYLGNFDILNYATAGGVGSINGTTSIDMTDQGTFDAAYGGTLAAILGIPNSQVVVGTIPDITTLPYFNAVTWDAIEFSEESCSDAETIAALNGADAFGGFNAALDGLVGASVITPEEAAKRKVYYQFGNNGILIKDETLADLTVPLQSISLALTPYGQARQATAADIITLPAGALLGTCAIPPGATDPSPSYIIGVSAPLTGDQYVLLPAEIEDILARTASFNAKIVALADANADRVAVADVNKAYKDLVEKRYKIIDNITITPEIAPPTGIFSEDGVHPNSRGYAFTANVFIEAINAKFTAKIPNAKLTDYHGTGLPVNP